MHFLCNVIFFINSVLFYKFFLPQMSNYHVSWFKVWFEAINSFDYSCYVVDIVLWK